MALCEIYIDISIKCGIIYLIKPNSAGSPGRREREHRAATERGAEQGRQY